MFTSIPTLNKKLVLFLLLFLSLLFSLLLFSSANAQTPGVSATADPISTPICAQLELGDADCSGEITLLDFEVWRTEYNHERLTFEADFDGDRIVGNTDYNIWAVNFTSAINND